MSVHRSAEILRRTIQEHTDAHLLIGVTPAGMPIILSYALNPALCITLNALLSNICSNGGIMMKQDESD